MSTSLHYRLELYEEQGTRSMDCAADSKPPEVRDQTLHKKRDGDGRYALHKTLVISAIGDARVMAHSSQLGMLVVSKPSNNHILPGYGVMKYSTLDFGHGEYMPVHSRGIRDIVFSPRGDSTLLTAGLDNTCRLTSLTSNSIVQRYTCMYMYMYVYPCNYTWNSTVQIYVYVYTCTCT